MEEPNPNTENSLASNPWYTGTLIAAFGGAWLLLGIFAYDGIYKPATGNGPWPEPIGILVLGLLFALFIFATYVFVFKLRMRPP